MVYDGLNELMIVCMIACAQSEASGSTVHLCEISLQIRTGREVDDAVSKANGVRSQRAGKKEIEKHRECPHTTIDDGRSAHTCHRILVILGLHERARIGAMKGAGPSIDIWVIVYAVSFFDRG